MTRKIVSEMTYNVSMGTLNPTIPILSVKFAMAFLLRVHHWQIGLPYSNFCLKTFVQLADTNHHPVIPVFILDPSLGGTELVGRGQDTGGSPSTCSELEGQSLCKIRHANLHAQIYLETCNIQ